MSLSYYFDEHVPSAIANGVRARGIDVLYVQDDGHGHVDDDILLDRAGALGRVMFTQDDDFLRLANWLLAQGVMFATVLYAHQLRVSIGRCIEHLEFFAVVAKPAEAVNHVYYLPLY